MLKMQSILCEDCRKRFKAIFTKDLKGNYDFTMSEVPRVCEKCKTLMEFHKSGYTRDYIPEAF